MSQKALSRRDVLIQFKQAAIAATAVSWLSVQHVSSALAYVPNQNSTQRDGVLLTRSQLLSLKSIAQTIIPATDTPGAGDVDCHGFVDHQLVACHTAQQQNQVIEIIKDIDKAAQSLGATGFSTLNENHMHTILTRIEARQGFSDVQKDQFKFLKQLIVFGYFTSQVGATQALNYQAVPGGYRGSIPADDSTKSWGSLMSY